MEYVVPVECVHIRGVSPIQGAGLEGFHCMYYIYSMCAGFQYPKSEYIHEQ